MTLAGACWQSLQAAAIGYNYCGLVLRFLTAMSHLLPSMDSIVPK